MLSYYTECSVFATLADGQGRYALNKLPCKWMKVTILRSGLLVGNLKMIEVLLEICKGSVFVIEFLC